MTTLDDEGTQALANAREEARTLRHDRVGTEHLLLGLLRLDGGGAVEALDSVGVTLGRARAEVVRTYGTGSGSPRGELPLTPRAKKRLELAGDEAEALGGGPAGSGHLLLSLAREREGGAARVLAGLGVDGTELLGETRKTSRPCAGGAGGRTRTRARPRSLRRLGAPDARRSAAPRRRDPDRLGDLGLIPPRPLDSPG